MAKATFQKISGFKRISQCMGCRERFVATKTNIYFCEKCSKKRTQYLAQEQTEDLGGI